MNNQQMQQQQPQQVQQQQQPQQQPNQNNNPGQQQQMQNQAMSNGKLPFCPVLVILNSIAFCSAIHYHMARDFRMEWKENDA